MAKINPKERRKILKKHNYTCQICGKKTSSKNLELHHINPLTKRNKPSNIMVVCKSCHDEIHAKLARSGIKTYADFIKIQKSRYNAR